MITDSYDPGSEPIVKLEAFYGQRRHLVQKCIPVFSKIIYDHILAHFSCRQIAQVGACNGTIPVWTLTHEGAPIAFYLTPIGSALAAATLAEVSHLTGASVFILFGSCGSLDKAATEGRFILPSQAYRGEGLSYYFAPPQDYIDIKNAPRLAALFSEWGLPYVQGRVWTTDCMLRETVNLVRRRREEGCIAVEMELAGVQAICDFYGFELYGFLIPGDVLTEGAYETDGLPAASHGLAQLSVALRIAKSV